MRDCFSEHFGTVEIIHTGQTEDGAISLKMILTDSETYLVHVNRRSSISGVEDVRAVKALNGIIFRDDCAANMVVTTAPGFGAAVKQETAAINEPNEKYEIPLLAFHDILQLLRINKPSPYEPWMTYIEDIDYSEDNHFLKSTYFGREKCPHCSGIGKIWTGGGCTMEHGISTSCEEYGCPPRTETKCPVCNGDGDLL